MIKIIRTFFNSLVFILCALLFLCSGCNQPRDAKTVAVDSASGSAGIKKIQDAYAQQQSNLQVEAGGKVVKILKDDYEGVRHQRFIVEIAEGQTVLVTHNIDLAPRIENLSIGDTVTFYGEYEWNNKGGVIHWTHHDPQQRHPGGWIEHQGKRYE